jgi:hypothetical protein
MTTNAQKLQDDLKFVEEQRTESIEKRGHLPALVTYNLEMPGLRQGALGVRPGQATPNYHPARDMAHLSPKLIHAVAQSFDDDNYNARDLVGVYLREGKITKTHLAEALGSFVDGIYAYARNPGMYANAQSALQESGWYRVPLEARMAFQIRLGELIAATMMVCLAEINPFSLETRTLYDVHTLLNQVEAIKRNIAAT